MIRANPMTLAIEFVKPYEAASPTGKDSSTPSS